MFMTPGTSLIACTRTWARRPTRSFISASPGASLSGNDALPSQVREDSFATHDYASIALEFDDGRDLTWYWSAALPEGHHYRCPLPRWAARETHLVVRSGVEGLGAWVDQRCDVQADVARALGRVPSHIVAVWLIAVSLFQRDRAFVDFRRIALIQDGRASMIFPG